MPDFYPYELNEPDPSIITYELSAEDMDCDEMVLCRENDMVARLEKYHHPNRPSSPFAKLPNPPDEVVYLERKTDA